MTGVKKYLQPKDHLMNAIHDVAELQKARTLSCDSPYGKISLEVTMYASKWEYRFAVSDIGANRSAVSIELAGDAKDARRLINHEFALLDYVLKDRAQVELSEMEDS